MWQDDLKEAGVSIHVIATGAGAGLQQELWEVPGSSAYLSGTSFPYAPEEQEELLGFMPEHFCSEENAIDLASSAYMKAYRFGGKKPIGVGIAASVASDREHRGDLRVFCCVISNDKAVMHTHTFNKEVGREARLKHGHWCDVIGRCAILEAYAEPHHGIHNLAFRDVSALAKTRFFEHPFFDANGKRSKLPPKYFTMMPGAFNPPHEGHFGMALEAFETHFKRVVFETTAEPPHKGALSVQELLQRAKLLQGHDRFFSLKMPYYLDKARAFPNTGMVMGADACLRMFDPKWGINIPKMLEEFKQLGAEFYVADRTMNGVRQSVDDVFDLLTEDQIIRYGDMFFALDGMWNISSTEIRKKLL